MYKTKTILFGVLLLCANVIGASPGEELCAAIYAKDVPALEQLLSRSEVIELINVPDSCGCLPLNLAVGNAYKEEDDDGIYIGSYGDVGIAKTLDIVRMLLAAGANPCMEDIYGTALDCAIGNAEVVRMLLAAGADPHNSTLNHVNNAEVARILLEAGVDPHNSTLHHVNNAEVARILLEAGVDPHIKNEIGDTVLHCAVYNAEVVRILLNAGVDPHIKNEAGDTALHCAVRHANAETAHVLIRAGVNLNAQENDQNRTPLFTVLNELHSAGQWCEGYTYPPRKAYEEIITVLLENGADITISDVDGMTPLHIAAHDCHPDMVEILLAHGADVHAETSMGKTAFSMVLDEIGSEYKPFEATKEKYIRILEIIVQRSGQRLDEDALKAIVAVTDHKTANRIWNYHFARKHAAIHGGLDICGLPRDLCSLIVKQLYI